MDATVRERFERLLFSFFNTDRSFARDIGHLPELHRIGVLSSEAALLAAASNDPALLAEQQARRAARHVEIVQCMRVLEDKYGDGRFAERQACLADLLAHYEKESVNLEAVCTALGDARNQRRYEASIGRGTDVRRLLGAHGKLLKTTRNALLALEQSYLQLLNKARWEFVILEELDNREKQFAIVRALKDLRDLLAVDPLVGAVFSGPYRRPRRGRPRQEWLKQLRSRLRLAGVPDDPQETLLRSTGLLPYPPPPPIDRPRKSRK
jgi:hypothetical protein